MTVRLALAVCAAAVAAACCGPPALAAPWCGTTATRDRLPQVVPGASVHVAYVHAADTPDRSAERAVAIAADVQEIDAWWRGQDPLRAPRWDLSAFACEPQIDLTVVRTPQTAAQLAPLRGRADLIIGALDAAGLNEPSVRYLAYYDGPTEEPDTCGQGSGAPRTGPGYGIVYLGACSDVPHASIAAHELLHALGALPEGAPNACPDSRAHSCDSLQDVLYPFASVSLLAQLLLDVGRNDYYAHGGTWFDLQDSLWLRRLDAAQARLTITVSGGGRVSSDPVSVLCAATCAADWDAGSTVTLFAQPAAGRRLLRWGGGCAGAAGCTLTLRAATQVTATFGPARFPLSVLVAGRGVVRSTPDGLVCRSRCTARFTSFQPVRLRASAQIGWRFARWSGGCSGTHPTCTVLLRAAATARAVFVRR